MLMPLSTPNEDGLGPRFRLWQKRNFIHSLRTARERLGTGPPAAFIMIDAPEFAHGARDAEQRFLELRALWMDSRATGEALYDVVERRARVVRLCALVPSFRGNALICCANQR